MERLWDKTPNYVGHTSLEVLDDPWHYRNNSRANYCSINKMMYSREGFSANDQSEGFVRCCVNFNCVSPQGRHDMQWKNFFFMNKSLLTRFNTITTSKWILSKHIY